MYEKPAMNPSTAKKTHLSASKNEDHVRNMAKLLNALSFAVSPVFTAVSGIGRLVGLWRGLIRPQVSKLLPDTKYEGLSRVQSVWTCQRSSQASRPIKWAASGNN
jgi:hypothetical protein